MRATEPPRPRSASVEARRAGERQRHIALRGGGRSDSRAASRPLPRSRASPICSRRAIATPRLNYSRALTAMRTRCAALWSSGADVVHFATHALADLRQPLASLLVLPAKDAAGSPAYLTAGQVQEWRGDVGLVFLSACESAIGPPRFAGGMPGLQSAFLRAGARGVVATLWPIEDVLAREFTADFYQRFTRGESAAQALSATQRAWLAPARSLSESDFRRRRITALAHGTAHPRRCHPAPDLDRVRKTLVMDWSCHGDCKIRPLRPPPLR